jgi:hypothetical protein
MERIYPWVTHHEVITALKELEAEGLAESEELLMTPGICDATAIFWKKL